MKQKVDALIFQMYIADKLACQTFPRLELSFLPVWNNVMQNI